MFVLAQSPGVIHNSIASREVGPGTDFAGANNSEIQNGKAVQVSAGLLEKAVAGDPVAGVLAVDAGTATSYAGGGNSAYRGDGKDFLPFIPTKGDITWIADISTVAAVAGTVVPGFECGLEDEDALDATDTTNKDFRVLEVLTLDANDKAIKVKGVFLNSGWFAG